MITAQEARDLLAQADETVNFYLVKVDAIVKKALAANKRSAFLYVEDLWNAFDHFDAHYAEPSLSQAAVMRKLKTLGYGVTFGADEEMEPYVPRGLADDDGNGPLYNNIGITIKW